MNIGEPQRRLIVEPVQQPVPLPEPVEPYVTVASTVPAVAEERPAERAVALA